MAVPLRNVYYLLCYAWDRLDSRDLVDANSLEGNRAENLLGKVMHQGVADLLRRGLDRGFTAVDQDDRRVRGKVLWPETLGRNLLRNGRVACRFDELTSDVPHNRVVKAAMRALTGVETLDSSIRRQLQEHCRRLDEVADVALSPRLFRSVQLHRNIARYSFLIQTAWLVSISFAPDDTAGRTRFRPFTANEQVMGLLFEQFVRNFLRREQDHFAVRAPKIAWNLGSEAGDDARWLPEMKTDMVLQHRSQRALIEAKYYASPLRSRFGSKKLRSGHLYQLLAYLEHMCSPHAPHPLGVLLYARAGDDSALDYQLGRHRVLVRFLDLDQRWEEIHRDLLALADELKLAAPAPLA